MLCFARLQGREMSKSALRVLEIMEFIGGQPTGCSHTAVAQGLNIPKSSLTALLQDLQSKGYLQRNPDTGAFTIGIQVLWLANSYLRNLNLVKVGQPVVAELFSEVKEFSLLAMPSGTEYVVICTESVPSIFGHTLQIGSRGPLYCTALGKAILAFSPQAYVDDILKASERIAMTRQTKTKDPDVLKELEAARKSGIARSRGEAIAGVDGFAAPVFNGAGVPVAALGVGVPSSELTPVSIKGIEASLKRAAAKLSAQLGWQGPERL
jgi:DNA-binding IclR family transcriptional regulator